jgi:hypothetical protein
MTTSSSDFYGKQSSGTYSKTTSSSDYYDSGNTSKTTTTKKSSPGGSGNGISVGGTTETSGGYTSPTTPTKSTTPSTPPPPEPVVDANNPPEGVRYEVRFIKDEDLASLGLDESYKGLPMSVGFWYDGKWYEKASKLDVAQQMHDLRNLERPEMVDLTSTQAYQNLVDLTDQLASGELVAQDQQEGREFFEELMGFSPGGYSQRLSAMEGLMGEGIQGQEGLTPEHKDIYNRQTQIQLQQMREDSAQLMESLGASGRSVAGFQAMVQLSRNQADFQSQRDLELLTQDLMLKQAEYDALSNRYEQLFNMGQITIGQYSSALRENRMAAIQGYAQQITTMAQQNQQNLQAYETHAQVMYNNLMADLGVSKGLLDEAAAHYEMYMAPITAAREKQALEDEKKAAEAKRKSDAAMAGVAAVSPLATAMFAIPGVGTIGAAATLAIGGLIGWLLG